MAVKIRLMRIGSKGRPFYRVVAVDGRRKRTGGYIELLGTYNPLTEPKQIILKQDRIDEWVKNGAELSTGFLRIIKKAPQRLPRKPKKAQPEPVAAPTPAPVAETPVEAVEETPVETAEVTTPVEPETSVETTETAPVEAETSTETAEAEPAAATETSEAPVAEEVPTSTDTESESSENN